MKDVTILIPAYNEEKHIKQAILSAVTQAEFVIVSDNCSTDKTPEICKKLAKKYKNLIFYEQENNIGSYNNGKFLCSKVSTKYLMTMGGHDILSENYVVQLKKVLEEDSACVLAYPTFINIDDSNKNIDYYDVNELKFGIASNDVFIRVYTIINRLSNCSIFFGLYRTNQFLESWDFSIVSGIDHFTLCNLALKGKFIQNTNAIFYRRYPTIVNNQKEYMKRISGETKIDYDLSYMCKKQFELVNNLDCKDKNKKEYFIKLSKKSLQRRHAKLCFSEIKNKIEALTKLDENFLLYGAGTIAELVLDKLSNKIEYIVDKDKEKHGVLVNGIEIRNIESIFDSNLRIIISVLNETILDELISIGIEYERIILLNILDNLKGNLNE